MANSSNTRARPTRPRLAHRTLSSSLRVYSSPLLPREQPFRARTLPPTGGLATTHEASETDALLGSSIRNKSISVASMIGSIGTAYDTNDNDGDEADLEADQSDEQADSDGLYPPNCCWTSNGKEPPKRSDPFGNRECDVYGNIHRVRREIMRSIDDPYSLEQLKAPRINISMVRPLVDKFYSMQDLSIVYCLLVNRAQFIREQSYAAHHQTVNLTRALLCELLAEKVLRRYNEANPGPRGLLKLANILVASFEPFQGASDGVIRDSIHATISANKRATGSHHHKLTALEVAIVSESKSFLASAACQKVVDAIYRGKVVYSPSSFIDIIPDRWKRRPISLYDPRRAPLLNQYRMVVPRTRNWIEVFQFVTLLALYITVMAGRETRQTTRFTPVEAVFDIYAFGWILDQLASILEHGWQVYTQNLWSFLDVIFSTIFMIYFTLRMQGLKIADAADSDAWAIAALDVLSCAAPILVPRLAFNIMSENMLFLSLRAMMGDFVTLTILAIWCFAGFLLSLKWLHNGLHDAFTISKWMIFVWFGLDGTGIDQAHTFHPYLGPVLMVTFAFLGNTLFLTILVSMLTNTFSMITSNAVQEIQFRRAVLTFMGVKSDSLFAFMPPFNLAALVIFGPLKWILTPRMFHTVNVFMVRVLNFPFLILVSWYERRTLWISSQYRHIRPKRIDWKHTGGPRVVAADWWSQTLQLWDFSKFSAHGDIQAVFDSEPPEHVLNEGNDHDDHDGLSDPDPKSPATTLGNTLKSHIAAQFHIPFSRSPPTNDTATATATVPTLTTTNNNNDDDTSEDSSRPNTPARLRWDEPKKPPRSPLSYSNPQSQSQSPTISRPKSKPRRKRDQRNASTTSADDVALRREFHDSEDEQERLARRKSRVHKPSGKNTPIKRMRRKDSMVDYDDANLGAMEANARLSKLEQRLVRMESILVRVAEGVEMSASVSVGDANIDVDAEDIPGSSLKTFGGDLRVNSQGLGGVDVDEDGTGSVSGTDADAEEAVLNDYAKETAT